MSIKPWRAMKISYWKGWVGHLMLLKHKCCPKNYNSSPSVQWANHTLSQGLCYFIFAQRWVLCGEFTKLSAQVKMVRILYMLLTFICSAYLIYSMFSIWLFLSCAELTSYLGLVLISVYNPFIVSLAFLISSYLWCPAIADSSSQSLLLPCVYDMCNKSGPEM